jgi:anthranilate phosphoribosyltransferase
MLPYVLSIYLHLQSQGMIVYNYDSIDEVANASSDPTPYAPNNLLLHVSAEEIALAECSPEDLGFARAELSEIREEEDLDVVNDDFWNIISGRERGPKRDFIAANTAVLLVAAGQVPAESGDLIAQLRVGIKMVEDLIDSGRSEENFRHLLATHNQNH